MEETRLQLGPYVLIKKIGRGAFGVVWLAERRTALATTRFALKTARDEDVDLDAFRREASVWVRASGHPNVVPLIEADIFDGKVVLVSEYVPDGSLEGWLERHGGRAPSVESACELADGILAGLSHLHGRHIVHRDLKPDNILLLGETPRLADFGIARLLRPGSHTTIVCGTPAYMAPEAFDGKRDERTDIWSVGVILYQMLAGRLPHSQQDTSSLIGAIVRLEPPPLPNYVPASLRIIVSRSLERDPSLRYPSAAEMRRELREAGYSSWRTATPLPASKPSRAWVWILASGAAGLLLLIAAVGVALIYRGGAPRAQSTAQAPASALAQTPQVQSDRRSDLRRWLRMLGRSDEVAAVVQETSAVLARDPADTLALRARGDAYYQTHEEDKGKLDAAEVERLLASPSTADEFEARCYARMRLQKYDQAVADCARAIEADPQYARPRFTRAAVYYFKKDYSRSTDDYDKGIELDPDFSRAYVNRGNCRFARQDYGLALADYNKAVELDPKLAVGYSNRGLVYETKQDYEHALADYDKAVELDPRLAKAYEGRGDYYFARKDFDRALAEYNKAIELDPTDATAYYNRGLAYAGKNDVEDALANYGKAIGLDPQYAAAYLQRGQTYYTRKDYKRSVADLTKAIQLDKGNVLAYFYRGNDYVETCEDDKAIADYGKAIELEPQNPYTYYNRGNAYFDKQDYERAIADYTEAIRLNPQFVDAYGNRANAYEKAGDDELAEADREKAQELKQ